LNKHKLHIVSFDIPYPANYGGVIDVFYKVKALAGRGVQIYLHCFEYGREHQPVLESLCKHVFYYKRDKHWRHIFSTYPFIVNSRKSPELLRNLKSVLAPIIYEGHHCTYFLNHADLKDHMQYVRTHNVEPDYYRQLALKEKNILKKLYFYWEYQKLTKYETVLSKADALLVISMKDKNHYDTIAKTYYIKAFHQEKEVSSLVGKGEYAVYHGNLSVSENEDAVLFLINKVFKHLNINLVITGKRPSSKLRKIVLKYRNIRLVENPQNKVLNQLLKQAHVHVLPTFQDTGIKLKLLKSLYVGRHCIANTQMVAGTGLENACIIANSATEWIQSLRNIEELSWTSEDINNRKRNIATFNTSNEAQKLIKIIIEQT